MSYQHATPGLIVLTDADLYDLNFFGQIRKYGLAIVKESVAKELQMFNLYDPELDNRPESGV